MMPRSIDVQVRLFGALRRYRDDGGLALSVPEGSGPDALRRAVAARLSGGEELERLLGDCAVADESRVVNESTYRITGPCTLSLLPPVCGG
jgi:molybdopterin converting factor small subunit